MREKFEDLKRWLQEDKLPCGNIVEFGPFGAFAIHVPLVNVDEWMVNKYKSTCGEWFHVNIIKMGSSEHILITEN